MSFNGFWFEAADTSVKFMVLPILFFLREFFESNTLFSRDDLEFGKWVIKSIATAYFGVRLIFYISLFVFSC